MDIGLIYLLCTAVSCRSPSIPHYGAMLGGNFTFSKVIRYSCAKGYVLVGSTLLACQADGKWNGTSPVCQPVSCPDLLPPAWAKLINVNFTFGSIVPIECHSGFSLRGDSALHCNWSGSWNSSLPTCVPVSCPEITIPSNSKLLYANTTFSGKAVFGCEPGFSSALRLQQICLANATWSTLQEHCKGKGLIHASR